MKRRLETDTETGASQAPESDVDEERWLVCVDCGTRITRPAAAIAIRGSHTHEFMNPEGIRYVVRCFAAAWGSRGIGERSAVWTWFPGHAWQIEVCRGCSNHLGWSFHGAATFYGFIRERLSDR